MCSVSGMATSAGPRPVWFRSSVPCAVSQVWQPLRVRDPFGFAAEITTEATGRST